MRLLAALFLFFAFDGVLSDVEQVNKLGLKTTASTTSTTSSIISALSSQIGLSLRQTNSDQVLLYRDGYAAVYPYLIALHLLLLAFVFGPSLYDTFATQWTCPCDEAIDSFSDGENQYHVVHAFHSTFTPVQPMNFGATKVFTPKLKQSKLAKAKVKAAQPSKSCSSVTTGFRVDVTESDEFYDTKLLSGDFVIQLDCKPAEHSFGQSNAQSYFDNNVGLKLKPFHLTVVRKGPADPEQQSTAPTMHLTDNVILRSLALFFVTAVVVASVMMPLSPQWQTVIDNDVNAPALQNVRTNALLYTFVGLVVFCIITAVVSLIRARDRRFATKDLVFAAMFTVATLVFFEGLFFDVARNLATNPQTYVVRQAELIITWFSLTLAFFSFTYSIYQKWRSINGISGAIAINSDTVSILLGLFSVLSSGYSFLNVVRQDHADGGCLVQTLVDAAQQVGPKSLKTKYPNFGAVDCSAGGVTNVTQVNDGLSCLVACQPGLVKVVPCFNFGLTGAQWSLVEYGFMDPNVMDMFCCDYSACQNGYFQIPCTKDEQSSCVQCQASNCGHGQKYNATLCSGTNNGCV